MNDIREGKEYSPIDSLNVKSKYSTPRILNKSSKRQSHENSRNKSSTLSKTLTADTKKETPHHQRSPINTYLRSTTKNLHS